MLYNELLYQKPFFILGPCVIENENLIFQTAEFLIKLKEKYKINIILKSSFDKANRTSINSFRGPGINEGIKIFKKIKEKFNLPILTDIHLPDQATLIAEAVDIIQIPAFLCRQTDLLIAAGQTNKIVNIKKGQFLDAESMKYAVLKIESTGNKKILLTERGTTFGYNNLVVDFRNFIIMKTLGYPIVFDATHSVQRPSAQNGKSGGDSHFVPYLARAAAAIPVDGFFFEIHPEPDKALSDGPNMVNFKTIDNIISDILKITNSLKESL